MERRHFLAVAGGMGLGGFSGASHMVAQSQGPRSVGNGAGDHIPRVTSPGELRGEMLFRQLGHTGETVSAIGMGGFHLGKPNLEEAEAIRLIHSGLDRGITFLDNAWDYHDGGSEIRVGKALSQGGYRNKAFVMTKIDGRTREAAARQIDESLSRLKTDRIDLLQHHEIIRFEDPDRVFEEGGSMEAVVQAQKAGKIRYIGFTGHKDPHIHLYMLKVAAHHGFHFDTAQMPLNLMDAHFRSFAQLVVPRLVEQQTGVLGMKPMGGADGVILKSKTATGLDCLHYALNLPTSVVITGIDSQTALDQAFEAAKSFRVLSAEAFSGLTAKTGEVAGAGEFELYKTSAHFDSTAQHPQWLGGETSHVKELAPQNT
jgi:predicted aldo/keto reductase-like oxidoreductase